MWLERLSKYTTRGRQRKRNKKEKRGRGEKTKQEKTLTRILAAVVDRDKRDRIWQSGDLGDRKWQGQGDPEEINRTWKKINVHTIKSKGTGFSLLL